MKSTNFPTVESGLNTKMSRRQFLLLAGGTLGGLALASCQRSSGSAAQPIEWIDASYGEKIALNNKVLVAYASEAGSTIGVADALGKQLAAGGLAVDVRPLKEVKDLSGYRAAVIGSAIQSGAWLPEAVQFVTDHQAELQKMPTALFLVCMMAASKDPKNLDFVANFLEPVRAMVKPVAEGRFAGALLLNKYSFFESIGMRIFLGYLKLPPGDYRDWNAIRAWADQTSPLLAA